MRISDLPEMCFYFNHAAEVGKGIIAIKRGETGYYPTTYDEPNPDHAKAIVDFMNKKLGVSEAEALLMVQASMVGWHVIDKLESLEKLDIQALREETVQISV